MKKKIAAVLALALGLSVGLAGCGSFGTISSDDSYPFDAAIAEGYTGSEGEWLAESSPSTVYRRMWEEAVADGSFTGTYFEFLQALDLSDDGTHLQQALLSTVEILAYVTSSTANAGAGVILSLDSTTGELEILTNYHVVSNSNNIVVGLYGCSEELKATYEGGSAKEDIALLKVEADGRADAKSPTNGEIVLSSAAMAVNVGDSESTLVGDRVYAIGNPAAWGTSVTSGVLSVDAEFIEMDAIDSEKSGYFGRTEKVEMLEMRTDAVVNHGNSGGGLFNAAGELIGIVNARSEADGVEGVGYAIPINHAMAVVENLKENGGRLKLATFATVEIAESRSAYSAQTGRAFISEKLTIKAIPRGGAAAASDDGKAAPSCPSRPHI